MHGCGAVIERGLIDRVFDQARRHQFYPHQKLQRRMYLERNDPVSLLVARLVHHTVGPLPQVAAAVLLDFLVPVCGRVMYQWMD